jgi:hypothetical protein
VQPPTLGAASATVLDDMKAACYEVKTGPMLPRSAPPSTSSSAAEAPAPATATSEAHSVPLPTTQATATTATCGPVTRPPPSAPAIAAAAAYKPDWIEDERTALSIGSAIKPLCPARLALSAQRFGLGSTRLSLYIPDRLGSSISPRIN